MKKRTSWIIGIATAIVTLVSLNAAFGSRDRFHHGFYHHYSCIQHKEQGQSNGQTTTGIDSINRR